MGHLLQYISYRIKVQEVNTMYTATINTANTAALFRIINECQSPIFYTYNNDLQDLRNNNELQQKLIADCNNKKVLSLSITTETADNAMKLLQFMVSGNHQPTTDTQVNLKTDNLIINFWNRLTGRCTKGISA